MNNDFYNSVDKLIEFGLSANIASSMIRTMNECMSGMQMPNNCNIKASTANPLQMPAPEASISSARQYYVGIDNASVGPLSSDELKQLVKCGKVKRETLVWYCGLPGWSEAQKLEDVEILFSLLPPELPKTQI